MRLIIILAVRRNSPVKVVTGTLKTALLPWNCCHEQEQFISLLLDIQYIQPRLSSVFEPCHLAWAFFLHDLHSTGHGSGTVWHTAGLELSPVSSGRSLFFQGIVGSLPHALNPSPLSLQLCDQSRWAIWMQSCGSHMSWWRGVTQTHLIIKCGCLRLGTKGQKGAKALGCNFWYSKSRCLWTALFSFVPTPWIVSSTSFQRPTSSYSDTSLESSIILSRIPELIRWMPLTWLSA